MNTLPAPTDEQKPRQDLFTLSVAQLEERREQVSLGIEKTFHTICGMALMAVQMEPQFLKVVGLETTFQKLWEDLGAIVDAIHAYAALAQYDEQQADTLAQLLHKGLALLQEASALSPLWLTRRDAFIAQARVYLEDDAIVSDNTGKGITPP